MGRKLIRFIPALVWMGIIYWLSDRPAWESSLQSGGITLKSIMLIPGAADLSEAGRQDLALVLEPLIRDTAHVAEYVILFAAVFFAVGAFSCGDKKRALISLFICFLYACTDEWHQGSVPGRAVQLSDIAFDTAGAAASMAFLLFLKAGKNGIKKDRV